MTREERVRLIEQYKNGYSEVINALKDIENAEMDFSPARDKWSCREVIHHLADSETASSFRLRKLLVENSPYIQGYDQDEFAKRLHYKERPIEPALMAFQAVRANTSQLLDLMTEAEWKRTGEHSESGPYSIQKWLEIYAQHAHGHAEQIRRNREAYKERRKS
jgi:hypothetical protein